MSRIRFNILLILILSISLTVGYHNGVNRRRPPTSSIKSSKFSQSYKSSRKSLSSLSLSTAFKIESLLQNGHKVSTRDINGAIKVLADSEAEKGGMEDGLLRSLRLFR